MAGAQPRYFPQTSGHQVKFRLIQPKRSALLRGEGLDLSQGVLGQQCAYRCLLTCQKLAYQAGLLSASSGSKSIVQTKRLSSSVCKNAQAAPSGRPGRN